MFPSKNLNWPLMKNNVLRADLDDLIDFLNQDDPRLTQSEQVRAFEEEWSDWLGVRYSVFVNSGSSANLLSIEALKQTYGLGEIIVPTLTWVSDIAAVLQCGFTPVFVDIDPHTLGVNIEQTLENITSQTKAVFLTHILGFNGLNRRLLEVLKDKHVPLIEDVCESHGATYEGHKLGSFGLISNFSFYYAHHMSTIEGGMVCTDDEEIYQRIRMLRSHGMVRESSSGELKEQYQRDHPDLNPEFIFAFPAYNMRSTEINAVMGRSQLKRLDQNNSVRDTNFRLFLDNLDPQKYRTDFSYEGSCNYAFTLVLKEPDPVLCRNVVRALEDNGVEFRRGTSGGGNQLRQPYLQEYIRNNPLERYPEVEHIHFFGFYLGNYPELEKSKILSLCSILNNL